jgi:enoyl-CoA hydratase
VSGVGTVTLDLHGPTATLTLYRPAKLNAISLDMLAALERALAELRTSRANVVVVRGAGDRVFSVGADITQFTGFGATEMWRTWVAEGHRIFAQLADLRQVTVAVLDGLALGGGLEVALACDLRIASDTARVALPELGLGTVPGWGGTERLTRLVGEARAKEMVFTRRQVSADTALTWGLVNSVHPAEELDAAVDTLVSELTASAPIAQQAAKQIIHAAVQGASASILEALASGFVAGTDDFTEGVAAFAEKRAPRFRGA